MITFTIEEGTFLTDLRREGGVESSSFCHEYLTGETFDVEGLCDFFPKISVSWEGVKKVLTGPKGTNP